MMNFFLSLFTNFKKKYENLKYKNGKRYYYPDHHAIKKQDFDKDSIKVVYRLQKFGYKSYMVGGSIRDLLLSKRPKDFDIATNATPEQIKKIFINCRIIGKRFKIAHIIYKRKIIEVSTFQSLPETQVSKEIDSEPNSSLRNLSEDVLKRDITVNSLYFDVKRGTIIDFVGGFEDIKNKQIRTTNEPFISFQEDPVRMIRVIKFSVLTDFEIDKTTQKAIHKHYKLLQNIPSSRMFEEYKKIFKTTKTVPIFQKLAEYNILQLLFQESFKKYQKNNSSWIKDFSTTQIGIYLNMADKLNSERDYISCTVFYCILFSSIVTFDFLRESEITFSKIKEKLDPIFERLNLNTKERVKIVFIFYSQKIFKSVTDSLKIQNHPFTKKFYYKDAFNFFRIQVITSNNQQEMKYIFNWEIALKKKSIQKNEELLEAKKLKE